MFMQMGSAAPSSTSSFPTSSLLSSPCLSAWSGDTRLEGDHEAPQDEATQGEESGAGMEHR